MSSVTLTNISKKYDNGVMAVSDFNLEIEDKEFIVLVGPSGCGKSTTLRMIAGLEDITSGQLEIDGCVVNDVPAKDRDIAMVFQNYALYPHMSVFENMAFGLKIRKLPKAEIRRRVEEAARILEIESLLDRRPAALSGGQRQRVALGRAIVRNPKVFLLDEPLSNLDAKLRTAMRAELAQTHKRLETTFIYVTHDQTEAMTMGTRIVVLKDGFIQQVASPQDIFEKPANLFVATFIGTPQMNVFDGFLRSHDNRIWAEFGKGFNMPLSEEMASLESVQAYLDKKVIFGIRPSDIYDDTYRITNCPEWSQTMSVTLTELLGAETNLFITDGQLKLTAVVKSTTKAEEGRKIPIYLDMNKLHIFDPETERSVLY